jgi:peptide/nickel transport system substrate-binding protein
LKVEVQAMDWQTLVSRRAKKEPADKGGNALFTFSVASDMLNPVSANLFNPSCEKATCG